MKAPQTIGIFIWLIGMIVVGLVISRKKLFKFSGTRYRDRLVFSLMFSIILTLANLLLSPPDTTSLIRGAVIGIILMVPFSLWEKAWLVRRLDGAVLRYKPKQYIRNLTWCVPVIAGVLLLFRVLTPDLKAIILIGLCISWIGGSVLALLRLSKMEAKLGEPIMEVSGKAKESANNEMQPTK